MADGEKQPNKSKRKPAHLDLQACEELRVQTLEELKLAPLPFSVACRLWLKEHKRYIKPSTYRTYETYIQALEPIFGGLICNKIHIGHLRFYQDERGKAAGAYRIRGELNCLQQVLREAGCWKAIGELYKPIPIPKHRSGHSLTPAQERKLREVAFSHPKWHLAGHCMILMLSTTMGFGELRRMKRRDVDLDARCIIVREGAKNDFRDRTIPLNHSGYDSMCWIIERWEKLGGSEPDQYILPHRPRAKKQPWLLYEPMTAITTAFRKIRQAAGLPYFREYDCRVQAITKILADPLVSTQVAREIAGHISQAMQDRYSIQLLDTKRAALEALEAPAVHEEPEDHSFSREAHMRPASEKRLSNVIEMRFANYVEK